MLKCATRTMGSSPSRSSILSDRPSPMSTVVISTGAAGLNAAPREAVPSASLSSSETEQRRVSNINACLRGREQKQGSPALA